MEGLLDVFDAVWGSGTKTKRRVYLRPDPLKLSPVGKR